jgi:tetratricopeptide (TPR) repeat protein
MHNKSRYLAPQIKRNKRSLPAAMNNELEMLANTGQWNQLEIKARAVTTRHPEHIIGWKGLGKALLRLGKWTQSLDALSEAAKLLPGDADVHSDLGFVFYSLGREEEAEASYRRALKINPRFAEAHCNLSALLIDLGRLAEAAVNLQQSLEIKPDTDFALLCLGTLLDRAGGHDEEALAYLARAIDLNPNNVNAYTTLGNILWRTNQVAKSVVFFRKAQELRPLTTWPARKEKADFSVLLLYAPGSGCTPINYLTRKAPYDCHSYCVLPDTPQSIDLLRSNADVVINIIADADYHKDLLPFAQDLVEHLDRPTINHPRLIKSTDRETVARRLAGIPLCRIPKTMRLAGSVLKEASKNKVLDGFTMPLLVRIAGNHGGDDFEKLVDLDAVTDFVSKRPDVDYYVSEYVDYRSPDGFFRKYRLICIDGELLPYHLAIHDDWKVHHFRTDMANQAWMRQEEESFLKDPHLVFDEPHQEALRAVTAATGLDYSGIDCAFDFNGEIVVFETNAAMLVHDEKNAIFAYKNPYIAKIKDSFSAKLTRLAMGG